MSIPPTKIEVLYPSIQPGPLVEVKAPEPLVEVKARIHQSAASSFTPLRGEFPSVGVPMPSDGESDSSLNNRMPLSYPSKSAGTIRITGKTYFNHDLQIFSSIPPSQIEGTASIHSSASSSEGKSVPMPSGVQNSDDDEIDMRAPLNATHTKRPSYFGGPGRYHGPLKEGLPDGEGGEFIFFHNRGSYKGGFRAGKFHGHGKLTDLRFEITWEGTFSKGKPIKKTIRTTYLNKSSEGKLAHLDSMGHRQESDGKKRYCIIQ